MRYGRLAAAILAAGLFLAGAARAELTICNQTEAPMRVAIGSLEGSAYVSRGWIEPSPGNCGDPSYPEFNGYIYFHVDDPGFVGDGYGFCVDESWFYIEGDEDCEARGYRLANFKAVELTPGQSKLTLNIGAGGVVVPPPDLPVIDLSHPFTPPGKPQGPVPPAPAGGDQRYVSGLAEGANGPVFQLDGVFQGCETADGRAYCAFHAEGWKFFAYQGGPTPDAFLVQIENIPMGTPVTVAGDVVSEGDIFAEVALREVVAHAEDPFGDLRAAIQGDWMSSDDPLYRMTVYGSEAFEFYDGEQIGVRFLRIEAECDGSAGAGPVLLTTELEQFETQCFLFQDGLPDRMILALAGQGGFVSFERPR
ncbi:DUF1036 domain-containing protein [Frigidibacter sp. ROC022]|uniref:DUF1036 domain-containing protein n=1 Tax=Frigidibacter sp. ROC022 TaxID=2971796 RepID=UPI00215AAE0D|nr:DUF1036 domain-containing protein [Frigidibacter sp. ROC022]MCR8725823.1 DUF1036 domain-containing protein [Frigidibacter sp. ROC022]